MAKKDQQPKKAGRNMRKREDRPVVYWLISCKNGKVLRSRVKDDLRIDGATPPVKVVLPPMSRIDLVADKAVHANETLALDYSKSIQE